MKKTTRISSKNKSYYQSKQSVFRPWLVIPWRDFQNVVSHKLIDHCPVCTEDLNKADTMIRPNLPESWEKIMRYSPKRVEEDNVAIHWDLINGIGLSDLQWMSCL